MNTGRASCFLTELTGHRPSTSFVKLPKKSFLPAFQAFTSYSDLLAHTNIHRLDDFSLALNFSFNQRSPSYINGHLAVYNLMRFLKEAGSWASPWGF